MVHGDGEALFKQVGTLPQEVIRNALLWGYISFHNIVLNVELTYGSEIVGICKLKRHIFERKSMIFFLLFLINNSK